MRTTAPRNEVGFHPVADELSELLGSEVGLCDERGLLEGEDHGIREFIFNTAVPVNVSL